MPTIMKNVMKMPNTIPTLMAVAKATLLLFTGVCITPPVPFM